MEAPLLASRASPNSMLLLPLAGTEFEAWRPLRNHEDAMRLDFMYEMSYELMLHTEHYATGAWRSATPWR